MKKSAIGVYYFGNFLGNVTQFFLFSSVLLDDWEEKKKTMVTEDETAKLFERVRYAEGN